MSRLILPRRRLLRAGLGLLAAPAILRRAHAEPIISRLPIGDMENMPLGASSINGASRFADSHLKFAFVADDRGILQDIVNNQSPTISGDYNSDNTFGSLGMKSVAASSTYLSVPKISAYDLTGAMTILWMSSWPGALNSATGTIIANTYHGAAASGINRPFVLWQTTAFDGKLYLERSDGSGNYSQWSEDGEAENLFVNPHAVAVTASSGNLNTSTVQWFKGYPGGYTEQLTTQAVHTGSGTVTSNASPLLIGGDKFNNGAVGGFTNLCYYMILGWDYAFTFTDFQSFMADPWHILRTDQEDPVTTLGVSASARSRGLIIP